jgi:hypothetical protein
MRLWTIDGEVPCKLALLSPSQRPIARSTGGRCSCDVEHALRRLAGMWVRRRPGPEPARQRLDVPSDRNKSADPLRLGKSMRLLRAGSSRLIAGHIRRFESAGFVRAALSELH